MQYSTTEIVRKAQSAHQSAMRSIRAAMGYTAEGNEDARRMSLRIAATKAEEWAAALRQAMDTPPSDKTIKRHQQRSIALRNKLYGARRREE